MNKQKTDWERKLMTLMIITIADALFAGRSRPITKDCSDVTVKHHKKISKFISQLLKTQREEIVSEIEGIKRLPNMAQNQNGIEYCSACGCPWDNIDNYCPDCGLCMETYIKNGKKIGKSWIEKLEIYKSL